MDVLPRQGVKERVPPSAASLQRADSPHTVTATTANSVQGETAGGGGLVVQGADAYGLKPSHGGLAPCALPLPPFHLPARPHDQER
jgi:hypothetical protein